MVTTSTSTTDGNSSRISLFRKRRIIRQQVNPLRFEYWHGRYLKGFIRRHRPVIIGLGVSLFVQVILEMALPIYSHLGLGEFASLLNRGAAVRHLTVLMGGLGLYVAASFWYLKLEKSIQVTLINELRRRWFERLLWRPAEATTQNDRSSFIAKVTYHFSLLQLGLNQSLGGAARWLLMAVGLIIVAFTISTELLAIVLITIPCTLAVVAVGYLISKFYLNREAALSTTIVKYLATNLTNIPIIQAQARERTMLQGLDELVELDSYFKVRRTLWLEFGHRLIFALLLAMASVFYILQLYLPQLDLDRLREPQVVAVGIVLAYLGRLVYLSLRVGLYSMPAKLGFILSAPPPQPFIVRRDEPHPSTTVTFRSRQVKLSSHGSYLRDIEISCEQGQRLLIYGAPGVGKSRLARVLAGTGSELGKPWTVRLDGERFIYRDWYRTFRSTYLIGTDLAANLLVGEMVSGKSRHDLSSADLEQLAKILKTYPELDVVSSYAQHTAADLNPERLTMTERFLVQATYALVRQPQLVVVDNLWLDLGYPKINVALNVLERELTSSCLVCFAKQRNATIPYTTTYELALNRLSPTLEAPTT